MFRRTPTIFVVLISLALLSGAIAVGSPGARADNPEPYPNKRFELVLDAKSPPPEEGVYEVDPGERPGYMWAKGFWGWNGKRHIWQPGRWMKARPDYVWVADTWAQRGSRWRLYPGHWEKESAHTEEEVTTEAEHEMEQAAPVAAPAAATTKTPSHVAKIPAKRAASYHDKRSWPRVIHH